MKFIRRIGPTPQELGACAGCQNCPDILELEGGDFAIIGEDITAEARNLPAWAGCGEGERIVRIPRRTLVRARDQIPVA